MEKIEDEKSGDVLARLGDGFAPIATDSGTVGDEKPADDVKGKGKSNRSHKFCSNEETEPGDMVIFNQWLFHAVYGKCDRRRNIVLKFSDRATTDVDLAVLKQSPEVFNPHEALRTSRSPRIQHMIDGLAELGEAVKHLDG